MRRPKVAQHGRDNRIFGADPIPPGQWIYAGDYPTDPDTTELSPAFQNDWENVGSGLQRLRFRLTNEDALQIDGAVTGGVDGTVVITLPDVDARFRDSVFWPLETKYFTGSNGDDSLVIWKLEPNGDLTLVGTAGGGGASAAADVSVDSTDLEGTATDVQGALEELDDAFASHLTDATDAHDASAISVTDTGAFFTGTDVESVLQELGAFLAAAGLIIETPIGTINSSNVTFTLSVEPDPPDTLMLFKNGLLQEQGVDYTLSADTVTFATAPATGSTLLAVIHGSGTGGGGGGGGGEIAYVERDTLLTVTATSAATSQEVVTAGPITFDGSTTIMVDWFSPSVSCGDDGQMFINLFDDTTDLGRIAGVAQQASGATTTAFGGPSFGSRRLTPSAGSHEYKIHAWRVNDDGSIDSLAGGTDTYVPAYIRIVRV